METEIRARMQAVLGIERGNIKHYGNEDKTPTPLWEE